MTGNGVTWNYTYDSNGMRTDRTNGTTTYSYVYNGSRLSQMTVGSDTLRYRGYIYDIESRLYYLQSRYYTQRWADLSMRMRLLLLAKV